MYSTEEILSLLREGKSLDAIVSDFTDALNKANESYEAEKAANKEYDAKLNTLVEAIADFFACVQPELKDEIANSKDDMRETLNSAYKNVLEPILSITYSENSLSDMIEKLLGI